METPLDTILKAFARCTCVDKELYTKTEGALKLLAVDLEHVGYGANSEIDAVFEDLDDYMDDMDKESNVDDDDEDDIDLDDEDGELRDMDE